MMRSVSIAVMVLLLPSFALAWGGDGHQLVALIAENHLNQKAKDGIHDLLGKDVNISDAEIASWADQIRGQRRSTSPWHYVDIPVDAAAFDEKRDGHNAANVIDKLDAYEKVLADKSASKDARAEALKFVVHFAGDIHQPLHCADRNDKGGNTRLVFFPNRRAAVNLHQCWDSLILLKRKGSMRILDYANKLDGEITKDELKEWPKGSSEDWANESHKVAVDVAYKDIPADGNPPKLTDDYIAKSGETIDKQLEKGGMRLAMILNRAFAQ